VYPKNENLERIKQEERQKSYRKEKKSDRKRKADGELNLNIDPDMAAVMGFSGFGGSKK
jgi:U4/U6.U5 tri-snRNP component SNU23